MSPAARAAALEADATPASLAAADPEQEGAWTTAPFALPNFAIHAALLPTGKVLFWGYPPPAPDRPNAGRAALWDPSAGTGPESLREVPPPEVDVDGDGDTEPAPIYCSGQSLLPSGALLVAGGTYVWSGEADDEYEEFAGDFRMFTFDPWSEAWTEQPRMRQGRWYPSQVLMPDGRTALLGGYNEEPPGGVYNLDLEVYEASPSPSGTGTLSRQPAGDRLTTLYPSLFSMAGGDVLLAGESRTDSALLDPDTFTWRDLPPAARMHEYGAGVPLPGGPAGPTRAIQLGGSSGAFPPEDDGSIRAQPDAESIDITAAAPQWTPQSPMQLGRSNQNVVLLPDGSMASIGGGRGWRPRDSYYFVSDDHRERQIELWDPSTETWRLGPAQQEDRAYHSIAVLLPDGRVMSAGDDFHPETPAGAIDTAEIYSPPYLFRGERPQILRAPATIGWGESFSVRAEGKIARAVLMAPAATTHGADMQQRHVELRKTETGSAENVDLLGPPDASAAPPGYYMLFLLDDAGVPSVARWVRVGPASAVAGAVSASLGGKVLSSLKKLRSRGRVAISVWSDQPTGITAAAAIRAKGRKRWVASLGGAQGASGPGPERLVFDFPRRARKAPRGAVLRLSLAAGAYGARRTLLLPLG